VILHPALKLLGGAAQHIAADRIELPIGSEKAHDPLGLLKRLDKPVQQDPVKTPIAKADAVLVMFAEGIHRRPLIRGRQLSRCDVVLRLPKYQGYQGQSPWLVRSVLHLNAA
jgi:hypothetical protein